VSSSRKERIQRSRRLNSSTVQVQARRRDATMAATFWIDRRSGL